MMNEYVRQPTDPTYQSQTNPPQETGTYYVCNLCSAHVSDPKRHTLAVHRTPEQELTDPRRSAGPVQ
jgi:predicted SprT family Zn-dependent metalloprotease